MRVRIQEIIEKLEPSLGRERSESAVRAATEFLLIFGDSVESHDGKRILEHLQKDTGIVGVAARVAASRFSFLPKAEPDTVPKAVTSVPSTRDVEKRWSVEELAELVEGTVAREKVISLLTEIATKKGLSEPFVKANALALLEKLAETAGPVGISARFAKSKLILKK
ncbi:MAG: hypothetical protein KBF88_04360 [Polyangiaceae bacterium]|nr:hypothetical protein [Polyangiaceae bacterium]